MRQAQDIKGVLATYNKLNIHVVLKAAPPNPII